MEKRGISFRNEFLAFYLHAVTNVSRKVDHKRCAIQAFTPVIDELFLININIFCIFDARDYLFSL